LVTSLQTVTQKERVRKPIKDQRMVLESSKVIAFTAKSLDIVPETAERKKKKDLETDQATTATTATAGKDQGEIVLVTIDQGDIEVPDRRSVPAAATRTAPGQCDICGDKGLAGHEYTIC
jgi:hypothetical protein